MKVIPFILSESLNNEKDKLFQIPIS